MTLPFSRRELPTAFRDDRVLDVMERIPRELFLPVDVVHQAEQNVALPIGYGQTISQPLIVAYMSAALAPRPGQRVLEIGTGSGYQAAILAALGLEVFTVESVPELNERAMQALRELGLSERVHFRVGDGWHGWANEAPFDGIICTAAPVRIPPALVEQLGDGGRLVIPIGTRESQMLYVLEKNRIAGGRDELEIIGELPVRFVPLIRPETLS